MSTAVAGVQRSPHRRTGTDWDTDGAKCNPDRMIAHPARYFDRLPCDTDASLRRVRPRAAACRRATGPRGRGDPSATHPAGHVRVRPVRPVRLIRVTPPFRTKASWAVYGCRSSPRGRRSPRRGQSRQADNSRYHRKPRAWQVVVTTAMCVSIPCPARTCHLVHFGGCCDSYRNVARRTRRPHLEQGAAKSSPADGVAVLHRVP